MSFPSRSRGGAGPLPPQQRDLLSHACPRLPVAPSLRLASPLRPPCSVPPPVLLPCSDGHSPGHGRAAPHRGGAVDAAAPQGSVRGRHPLRHHRRQRRPHLPRRAPAPRGRPQGAGTPLAPLTRLESFTSFAPLFFRSAAAAADAPLPGQTARTCAWTSSSTTSTRSRGAPPSRSSKPSPTSSWRSSCAGLEHTQATQLRACAASVRPFLYRGAGRSGYVG